MREDFVATTPNVVLNFLQFHFGEILDRFRPFYYTESDEKHNKRIRESTINFNQNSLSLSLSHIYYPAAFLSVESESMEGAKEEEEEEEEEEESASEEALDRHDLELSLGFT